MEVTTTEGENEYVFDVPDDDVTKRIVDSEAAVTDEVKDFLDGRSRTAAFNLMLLYGIPSQPIEVCHFIQLAYRAALVSAVAEGHATLVAEKPVEERSRPQERDQSSEVYGPTPTPYL